MFASRQTNTMFSAALSQLALIYHQTVQDLRKTHTNAVIGLLLTVVQSIVLVAGFMALFMIMGLRNSPVRGDFLLYIMSGIFLFMTHVQTMGAVAGAGKSTNNIMKHGPMSTAVMITAAALAVLYRQVLATLIILSAYYVFQPFSLQNPVGCLAMLILAWASGAAIGMIFLAMRPWAPEIAGILVQVLMRANMVFSGKMFLANMIPNSMLKMFWWNPLFHIIDQMRGFTFINYVPLKTSLTYPIYVTLAIMMLGMLGEFATRKHASLSWGARH